MKELCGGREKLKQEKHPPKHSWEPDPLTAHFSQKLYINMWPSRGTVRNSAWKSWVCSRAEFCSLVSSWATRAAPSGTGRAPRVGTSSLPTTTAAFCHDGPVPVHGPDEISGKPRFSLVLFGVGTQRAPSQIVHSLVPTHQNFGLSAAAPAAYPPGLQGQRSECMGTDSSLSLPFPNLWALLSLCCFRPLRASSPL